MWKLILFLSFAVLLETRLVVRKITKDGGVVTTTPLPISREEAGCPEGTPFKVFRRKNGYWCSIGTYWPPIWSSSPMPKNFSMGTCEANGMVLSSLETKEEWDYWHHVTKTYFYNVTGVWIAAAQNTKDQKYYWNDGQAVETMSPQPIQNVTNGFVAWYPNTDPNVAGYGYLGTSDAAGRANGVMINMGICGSPGKQFK